MNVYEAMRYAFAGQQIKRKFKDEWIILANDGSRLRWVKNRQLAVLTPEDLVAVDWLIEDDEVTISRFQIEEALTEFGFLDLTKRKEFLKFLGFKGFESDEKSLCSCSSNKKLVSRIVYPDIAFDPEMGD